MKKLAYVGGVAVAALLATQAVSFAKDEKPAAAPAVEKKAAAAPAAAPAAPAAKPEAAKPAPPAAEAPAKMEPKPEPAKMEPPKPAPEVAEVFKQMQGTWKCTGSAVMGADGKSVPIEFTMAFKLDLDKFWIKADMTGKKTKDAPVAYKFTSYTTFDSATKKWARVMVDNMGGWETSTSSGPANNTITWEGKAQGMGMSYQTKHVDEMKGPKETHVAGQMSMDGKNWAPMYEATCKK